MSYFKEHIIFKIIALVLVLSLFTPIAVKFTHAFTHHKHEVCQGSESTHFHELDTDCEFYKFNTSTNAPISIDTFEILAPKEQQVAIISQYYFLSDYQRLPFSLRGPPSLV
jgi:hypothetical protein